MSEFQAWMIEGHQVVRLPDGHPEGHLFEINGVRHLQPWGETMLVPLSGPATPKLPGASIVPNDLINLYFPRPGTTVLRGAVTYGIDANGRLIAMGAVRGTYLASLALPSPTQPKPEGEG